MLTLKGQRTFLSLASLRWLRILLDHHDTTSPGGSMELGFEDAISVLNKIKRPVDLKYISEVFKVSSLCSAVKEWQGGALSCERPRPICRPKTGAETSL